MKRQHRIMVPEAFKVLPPLSPELPAPPRAPASHRVAPPVSRREKTAFVILNDERPPPSRGTSPSGRVSPFRGRGFREETSRHASREPSPSPETARKNPPRSRSRSRLPVAAPRTQNGTSTSSSPVRGNASGIPKPINRRNSLSPNRAAQVLNQNNRNKALTSPNHPVKSSNKTGIQSPQPVTKAVISSKRVGPTNNVRNGNSVATKPPLPRGSQPAQKENEKKNNLTSPYRRRPQPNKPDVTRSPSRIPRTRSISRGRVANVRPSSPHTSPQRALVRHSPRVQAKINGEKKKIVNGSNGENKTSSSAEMSTEKVESKIDVNGIQSPPIAVEELEKLDLEVEQVVPTPVEAIVSTVNGSDDKTPELEKKEVQEQPIEVAPEAQPVQSPPPSKPHATEEKESMEIPKPKEDSPKKQTEEDEVPEPTVTLVRTTTAPAMELAQPDVIPTIVSKGEQEFSKSISEDPIVEDKCENPGTDTLASVESVRSTTSIETVRATAAIPGETEVEVLSANNLMKSDSNGRNIAWDNNCRVQKIIRSRKNLMKPQHIVLESPLAPARCEILPDIHPVYNMIYILYRTPDMSPMNNSVHPLDPVLPLQPPKQQGCCGRLTDKLCCKSCRGGGKLCSCFKSPACCGKLSSRLGSLCSRLNCCKKLSCSCCKKKEDNPHPQPQRKSRLRECLSRLNCLRWSKCCKKTQPQPQQQDEDLEEGSVGCCAGCKGRCKRCYRGLFCLNRACCQRLRNCCRCERLACCRMGGCCGPSPPQLDRRKSKMSVRRSQSSIMQGIPKLDPTLVEHQSMMRGAVPVLPLPLAWMCCILNVFLPGSGTLLSGVFCLCFGKPRFSVNDSYPSRLTAFLINLVVSVSQLFTVLFCLVGWGWSIWWGVMMVKFARKQKRILLAEKSAEQPAPVAVNQNHDTERAR